MLYYGINYSDLKGFKYIERSIRKKVEQTEVRFKIQGNRKHVWLKSFIKDCESDRVAMYDVTVHARYHRVKELARQLRQLRFSWLKFSLGAQ